MMQAAVRARSRTWTFIVSIPFSSLPRAEGMWFHNASATSGLRKESARGANQRERLNRDNRPLRVGLRRSRGCISSSAPIALAPSRRHSSKNANQHAKFLSQIWENSEAHKDAIDWFRTLPVWIPQARPVVPPIWSSLKPQQLGSAAARAHMITVEGGATEQMQCVPFLSWAFWSRSVLLPTLQECIITIRITPNREMPLFIQARMRPSRRAGTSFPAIRRYLRRWIEILTRPPSEAVEAQRSYASNWRCWANRGHHSRIIGAGYRAAAATGRPARQIAERWHSRASRFADNALRRLDVSALEPAATVPARRRRSSIERQRRAALVDSLSVVIRNWGTGPSVVDCWFPGGALLCPSCGFV